MKNPAMQGKFFGSTKAHGLSYSYGASAFGYALASLFQDSMFCRRLETGSESDPSAFHMGGSKQEDKEMLSTFLIVFATLSVWQYHADIATWWRAMAACRRLKIRDKGKVSPLPDGQVETCSGCNSRVRIGVSKAGAVKYCPTCEIVFDAIVPHDPNPGHENEEESDNVIVFPPQKRIRI